MSRSNWGVIAATSGVILYLTLAAGAYFGSLYGPDHKQYHTVADQRSGKGNYQGTSKTLRDIAGVPGPAERMIANPPPEDGQDKEQRDLAAQEAMAVWAFWMVTMSLGTLLVAGLGTALIWKQVSLTRQAVEETGQATEAMREANEIARDTSRRQLRAYVSAEDLQIAFFVPGEEALLAVEMMNGGQTPAYNVRIVSMPFFSAAGAEEHPIRFGAVIEMPSRTDIAPGKSYAHIYPLGKLSEHVIGAVTSGALVLIYAGIISYSDAFGRRRRTTFRYHVEKEKLKRAKRPGHLHLTACAKGNYSN